MAETKRGPGYARMKARLGPKKAEALRQQVLKEQADALSEAGKHRDATVRDRDSYVEYPPPKSKRRKR